MKKQIPVCPKARAKTGWHKHLRLGGKRIANKYTRKLPTTTE